MDPVTHAASGAAAMLALGRRPATLWAAPLAALACASPDLDLAFINSPLEFLYIHRGISHSFAAAPVFGFSLALFCWPLWRKSTPNAWKFRYVWLFCIGMILLHIWLDVVTTYGTMVFLPFSHHRVRLNSIYIIDLLVTIPLLWAIWRWRAKRGLMLLVMAWIFIYPSLGIVLNHWHKDQVQSRLAEAGRRVENLQILPDAFAPLFWRAIYEEDGLDGPSVRNQSLNFLGQPRAAEDVYPAAPASLVEKLKANALDGRAFFNFAMQPVIKDLRPADIPEDLPDKSEAVFFMFHDLRFGSDLEFVRKLLALRPDADLPFLFMLELLPRPGMEGPVAPAELAEMETGRVRLRFSDSGRDSRWHKPIPPGKPTLLEWLAGLPQQLNVDSGQTTK